MHEREYKLKGPAFISLINYIKERRGRRGVDHIFSILKKEAPELYTNPDRFKTREMYPDILFIKLLEILDREYGSGDLKECYKLGYYNAHNLGVMGYLISFFATPATIIKRAPKSWDYYRNKGELVVTKLEPGQGIIEIRDYLKSKTICTEILGFFTGAAKQAKARNVKVEHTRCTSDGDPVCEFTIKWDA
jgi:predicted hydrocarbon binding protein